MKVELNAGILHEGGIHAIGAYLVTTTDDSATIDDVVMEFQESLTIKITALETVFNSEPLAALVREGILNFFEKEAKKLNSEISLIALAIYRKSLELQTENIHLIVACKEVEKGEDTNIINFPPVRYS